LNVFSSAKESIVQEKASKPMPLIWIKTQSANGDQYLMSTTKNLSLEEFLTFYSFTSLFISQIYLKIKD
jgi:hypothetical protein